MSLALSASAPARRFRWPEGGSAVIAGAVAVVALLALVPLVFLLWQSVHTPGTPARPGVFTLGNYLAAWTSPALPRAFANSMGFALGSAALAFALGTLLAWIVERTNAPFRRLFYVIALVPLIIPGILFTIAWIFLASPRIGWINLALQGLTGEAGPFVDIYSLPGMIWVEALQNTPMAFLLMAAAFRAMDPSLEESALMSGASPGSVALRVTLRLAAPAAAGTLLVLFVAAMESFETPALLGLPVNIEVFTSLIFRAVNQFPPQTGIAACYSVILLAITAGGIFLQSRIVAQSGRFATMTGKGFRPRRLDLGAWRWACVAVFALFFLLVVLLPFAVLLWISLQPFYRAPSLAAFEQLTLAGYREVLAFPSLGPAVLNSALLATGAATLVMLLTAVVCWITVKTRLPGRWWLDNLASLPMVFPGIVIGLAFMVLFLNWDAGIYGTIWILLIAYVARFMPYGVRFNTASMVQLHKELEESAAMSGASWLTSFRRIVLPLLKPGLLAGWIYVTILATRELSASILLYTPGNEVVSIVVWELWDNGAMVELAALAVMFILALGLLVAIAQALGGRFGVRDAG